MEMWLAIVLFAFFVPGHSGWPVESSHTTRLICDKIGEDGQITLICEDLVESRSAANTQLWSPISPQSTEPAPPNIQIANIGISAVTQDGTERILTVPFERANVPEYLPGQFTGIPTAQGYLPGQFAETASVPEYFPSQATGMSSVPDFSTQSFGTPWQRFDVYTYPSQSPGLIQQFVFMPLTTPRGSMAPAGEEIYREAPIEEENLPAEMEREPEAMSSERLRQEELRRQEQERHRLEEEQRQLQLRPEEHRLEQQRQEQERHRLEEEQRQLQQGPEREEQLRLEEEHRLEQQRQEQERHRLEEEQRQLQPRPEAEMPSEDRQRLEEERRLEMLRQEEAKRQQGPRMFPEGEGRVGGEILERRPFEEQPVTIPQDHPAQGEEVRIHVEVARPGEEAPSVFPAIITAPRETLVVPSVTPGLPAGLPTEQLVRGQPELPVTVQPAPGAEGEEMRIHVEVARPGEEAPSVFPAIIAAPSETPVIPSVVPGMPVARMPTEEIIGGQPELPITVQPAPAVITIPRAEEAPFLPISVQPAVIAAPEAARAQFFAPAAPVAPSLPVAGVSVGEIVREQPQIPIGVQPAPVVITAPETAPGVHEVTISIPAVVPSEIQMQPAILPLPGLPKMEEQPSIVATVPHEAAVIPEVIQPLLPPVEAVGVPGSRGQPTPVEFPGVIKLPQPSEPTRTGKKLELPTVTAAPEVEPVPPVERQPTEVPEWRPEATGEHPSEAPSVQEQQARPPSEEAPKMEAPGTGERQPEVTGAPEGQAQPPVEAPRSEAPPSLDVEAVLEKQRERVEPPRQQEPIPEPEPRQPPREPLMEPTVPAITTPAALPEEQRFEIYGAGADRPHVEVVVRPSAGLVVPEINVQPGGYEAPTQFNVPIVSTAGREPWTFYQKEEREPAVQLPVAPSAAALPRIEPEPVLRPRVLGIPPTAAVPRLEPRMLPGQTIVSEPLTTAVPGMQPQWLPRQPIVSVPPTATFPELEPQILQGQPTVVSVPPTGGLPRLEPQMLPRPTIVSVPPTAAPVPGFEPQILQGQPTIVSVPPTGGLPRLEPQMLPRPTIVSVPPTAAVSGLEPQILQGQPTIMSVPPTATIPRLQPQILLGPTIVSGPLTAAVPGMEPQWLPAQPIVNVPSTSGFAGMQSRMLPGARLVQPVVAPPSAIFREVTQYPQASEVVPPPVPVIPSGMTQLSDVELLVPLTGDVYIDNDNIPSDSEDLPVIGQLSPEENAEFGKTGLSYPYKFKDFRSYYFRPTSALNVAEEKE